MFIFLFSIVIVLLALSFRKWHFLISNHDLKQLTSTIKAPNSIKFGTFNVNLMFTNTKNRGYQIACLINNLNLDVIVIQECWNCFGFRELAKKLNYKFSLSALNEKELVGSGMCCFSKYKINFQNHRTFLYQKFPESLVNKGILSFTIGSFQIMIVHFPDSRSNLHSIDMLFSEAQSKTNVPLIVAGDFNICARDDAKFYVKLAKIGNNCFPLSEPTWRAHTYDYIFHQNTQVTNQKVIDMQNLSDHHGLVSTFSF